jgi:hypothetical protein
MSAKRRTLGHRRKLPPVRVFVDDVERILEILRQLPGGRTTVETDEHELGEAAEMTTLERVSELSISCVKDLDAWIRVTLERSEAVVWFKAADPAWRGAATEVEDVLRRRTRKVAAFLRWCAIPLWIAIVAMFVLGFSFEGWWARVGALVSVICLGIFASLAFVELRRYAIIVRDRSTNATTFWRRNSDALLVNAISAAVGFVLGFLSGRL